MNCWWTFCGIAFLITNILLSPRPARADLVLRYSFDEASSGNGDALDSGSGPAANGVFANSATRVASTPRNATAGALALSATSDRVAGPDADKLDSLSAMTVCAWINMQDVFDSNLGYFFASDFDKPPAVPPAGNGGWNLTPLGPNGAATKSPSSFSLNYSRWTSNGSSYSGSGFVSHTLSADHRWVFYAFTANATNLNYFGGDENVAVQLLRGFSMNATGSPNNAPFTIGAPSGYGFSPTAWFDDVRVYDTVLTTAQLEAVRLENLPEPATPALLALAGLAALGRWRKRDA